MRGEVYALGLIDVKVVAANPEIRKMRIQSHEGDEDHKEKKLFNFVVFVALVVSLSLTFLLIKIT